MLLHVLMLNDNPHLLPCPQGEFPDLSASVNQCADDKFTSNEPEKTFQRDRISTRHVFTPTFVHEMLNMQKKKKRERIKLNLVVCELVFIPFWPLQNPNMHWEIHEMLNIKFTVRPGRETIKETTLWRFLSGFNGSVDTRRALAADGQTKSCKLLLFVVVDLGIETLWWPELTMDEQLFFINGLVTAKTGQKHFLFAPRVRKWSSRYTVWSPSSAGNWRSGSQGRTMCRRQSRTCFSSSSL